MLRRVAGLRTLESLAGAARAAAEEVATIKVGDVTDFGNFMGAVIDGASFSTQAEAIEEAKRHADTEIVVGGGYDDSRGFFVEPTVVETRDPDFRLLRDELFGPVVTTYVYDERRWDDTLDLIDRTAPYGLTGAVFSEERGRDRRRARRSSATRRATSTSTTSRPARSSASSRSAARARRARTTRPARSGT